MLNLSRKVGELIKIGEDITIGVTKLERGKVCLAIQAPKTIRVYRGEVYERIKKEEGQ